MEDASLDQFLGGDADVEEEENASGPADEAIERENADSDATESQAKESNEGGSTETEPDETPADTDVGGATPTMVYAPDGAPCDACGETVERRWVTKSGRRCESCTEW